MVFIFFMYPVLPPSGSKKLEHLIAQKYTLSKNETKHLYLAQKSCWRKKNSRARNSLDRGVCPLTHPRKYVDDVHFQNPSRDDSEAEKQDANIVKCPSGLRGVYVLHTE